MRPVDEETAGIRGRHVGLTVTERQTERRHGQQTLARDREPLAAGRQDAQSRAAVRQCFDELGHGTDEMLAVVEHKEKVPIRQILDHGRPHSPTRGSGDRQPRRDSLVELRGVADGGQLNDPHTSWEARQRVGRGLQREARLADPAHAGQRDDDALVECSRHALEFGLPTHERARLRGQVRPIPVERSQRREAVRQVGVSHLVDPLGSAKIAEVVLAEVREARA